MTLVVLFIYKEEEGGSEGGELAHRGIPQGCFGTEAQSLGGGAGGAPYLPMFGTHETLVDGALQLLQQGVEVAVGVEHDDGFEVNAELLPGNDFEQLFERADAAGQGYAGIAHRGHALLAAAHVGGDAKLRHALVVPVLLDHELRNDAHGAASRSEAGVGAGSHQAGAAGTVDQRVAFGGQQAA